MLLLLMTLLAPPVFAENTEPAPMEQVMDAPFVVDAPLMSEDEVPLDDPVTRQDNQNKALIIALAIALGGLLAMLGTLVCCCCFYYYGYY